MTNFEKWKRDLTEVEFPAATDGACGNCPVWNWDNTECAKIPIEEHPSAFHCFTQKRRWARAEAEEATK